jgi:hypothetical protein
LAGWGCGNHSTPDSTPNRFAASRFAAVTELQSAAAGWRLPEIGGGFRIVNRKAIYGIL